MATRSIFVVTGDPGGARVLIPGIVALRKKHPRWKFEILAGSHSLGLWKSADFRPKRWPSRAVGRVAAAKMLQAQNPDVLVTGTSFENPTESWFRLAARESGLPSFSVLDHWCNYRHRYEIRGRLIVPNLIGVMDGLAARQMVRAGISPHALTVVGHPVLEPFMKRRRKSAARGRRVLFLSEPISWNGELDPRVVRYPGHNELTVLRQLLGALKQCPGFELHIRSHPLEPVSRLRQTVRRHSPPGLRVTIDRSRPLEKDLDASRVVLGITSIALLQARLMGKPVLSLQDDHARGRIPDDILCFLPRVRSRGSFIQAVLRFIRLRKAGGKWHVMGTRPRFPANSVARIAKQIERFTHG